MGKEVRTDGVGLGQEREGVGRWEVYFQWDRGEDDVRGQVGGVLAVAPFGDA